MLKNYFIVIIRTSFKKGANRLFTLINISGLVIGLASFLIIAHLVRYELTYDSFFPGAENIFRIKVEKTENGQIVMQSAKTYPGVGPVVKAEVPEVADFTRILAEECMLHYKEKDIKFNRQKVYWADGSFPSMFSLEFVEKGNIKSLNEPYTSIISYTAARRFFGDDWKGANTPVGKTIWLNEHLGFSVQGVFSDIPRNSHMEVDFIVSYSTLASLAGPQLENGMPPFGNIDYTYIALQPGASVEAVEKLTRKVLKDKIPASAATDASYVFSFQPLESIHLDSHLTDELRPNGNKIFVIAMSLGAALILIVALINFINLTTARAMERAKEVGVRKAIGSTRNQLVSQFIFEALFSCVIAAIGALIVVVVMSGYFENLSGTDVSVFSWGGESIYSWVLFVAILLGGGLLSSIYPAVILSSFKPIEVLKGKVSTNTGKGSSYLRKGLITFQFFFAVFLLSSTAAIYYQVNYMREQALGMEIDQVLVLHSPRSKIGNPKRAQFFERFREKLLNYPGIERVGASGCLPGENFLFHAEGIRQSGSDTGKNISFDVASVEEGYLPSLGFEILAGRNFSSNAEAEKNKVIPNETALRVLGFKSPEDAIGKTLLVGDTKQYEIAGVVSDAHYEGLQNVIRPLLLYYGHNYEFGFFTVKVNTADLRKTLAMVQDHWSEIYPSDPFDYFFLDSFFDEQYKDDRTFGKVFGIFSSLSIFIACFGLVGLVSFTTWQKTKEIGIRKVLGANIRQIFTLLTGEFFKPVMLACIIAIPITHYIITSWLDTFAYRFELLWWMHLLPLTIITCIAMLVISWQSFSAAKTNPVNALKEE